MELFFFFLDKIFSSSSLIPLKFCMLSWYQIGVFIRTGQPKELNQTGVLGLGFLINELVQVPKNREPKFLVRWIHETESFKYH